ncbi:MAG: hypothetical protein LDLANPLL_01617 [Turneriella sp.]|nr:hypothetical protein [Turneriella sp.]
MYNSIVSRVKPRPEGGFEHSTRDNILTGMGATADHFLRTYLSTQMILSNIPTLPLVLDKDHRKKWDFYRNPEFLANAKSFFIKPKTEEPVIRAAEPMVLDIADAIFEDIIFPSAYTPINPAYQGVGAYGKEQPPSIARMIRHKENSYERPNVIVVHGYVLDEYMFNAHLLEVSRFYRLGFNVLLYTMPYHGPRRESNARFSGDGFMVFDAGHIAENVRWSIHDLTRYIDYLESVSKYPIGMLGVSLGGFHTALMASLDKRLSFAIPFVPVVTLFDVILDWQPSAAVIQTVLPLLGINGESINETLAAISPLSRPSLVPQDHLFIIAGTADRMAHPRHAQSLWRHWGEPRMYWFPGNHLVHFEKERFMREITAFMRGMHLF